MALYFLKIAISISLIPPAPPIIWLRHSRLLIWADCGYGRSDIMGLLRFQGRKWYKLCLVLFGHWLWSSTSLPCSRETEVPRTEPQLSSQPIARVYLPVLCGAFSNGDAQPLVKFPSLCLGKQRSWFCQALPKGQIPEQSKWLLLF